VANRAIILGVLPGVSFVREFDSATGFGELTI